GRAPEQPPVERGSNGRGLDPELLCEIHLVDVPGRDVLERPLDDAAILRTREIRSDARPGRAACPRRRARRRARSQDPLPLLPKPLLRALLAGIGVALGKSARDDDSDPARGPGPD